MPLTPAAADADRIARASTALLASRGAADHWSRDVVDALRGLVRARQTALLVATDEQQLLAGDKRPSTILQQIVGSGEQLRAGEPGDGSDQGLATTGSFAIPDREAPPASSALGGAERFNLVWMARALADTWAVVGICCTFAPSVSRRMGTARLSLLRAVWPALEASVRGRIGRWGSRTALHGLVHRLGVGAALLAPDGSLLDVNRPLSALLAADGHAAQLRDAIAQVATAARSAPRPIDDDALIRTQLYLYRVRTWVVAAATGSDAPSMLVLVQPVTGDEPTLSRESLEPLRQRYRLTERETEVVRLLHLGHSNIGIANALDISPNTARHHTERVLTKLSIQSRAAVHRVVREAQEARPALDGRPAPPAPLADRHPSPVGAAVSPSRTVVPARTVVVVAHYDGTDAR